MLSTRLEESAVALALLVAEEGELARLAAMDEVRDAHPEGPHGAGGPRLGGHTPSPSAHPGQHSPFARHVDFRHNALTIGNIQLSIESSR